MVWNLLQAAKANPQSLPGIEAAIEAAHEFLQRAESKPNLQGVKVICSGGKPYSIMDNKGVIIYFPGISLNASYADSYREQWELAQYLLDCLK